MFLSSWNKMFREDANYIKEIYFNKESFSTVADRGFYSFLTTANLQNLHLGVWKSINNWNYLAVSDLMEFLNYMIYTVHEKEEIAPKFSAGNLLWKIITYDSATWKECSKKKVQYEKSATRQKQHKNSAIRKKSNMKIVQHGKTATWKEYITWKECYIKKVSHKKRV